MFTLCFFVLHHTSRRPASGLLSASLNYVPQWRLRVFTISLYIARRIKNHNNKKEEKKPGRGRAGLGRYDAFNATACTLPASFYRVSFLFPNPFLTHRSQSVDYRSHPDIPASTPSPHCIKLRSLLWDKKKNARTGEE